MRRISSDLLLPEITFTASRSGGPGGQHVNKVSSKVTLQFDVIGSQILTEEEKQVILEKLSSGITTGGVLLIQAQESRSQRENKRITLEKFDRLLTSAFAKKKKRKATRPSKTAVQERLKKKKAVSQKKRWRQKPDKDE